MTTQPTARTDAARANSMLPNLMLIGGMHCGTHHLANSLARHSDVFLPRRRELDFFVDGPRGNWKKGVAWYEARFEKGKRSAIRGDLSTRYTRLPTVKGVAARMFSVLPDAKLLYIVRDPVDRMTAHYAQQCSIGQEHRSPQEALLARQNNPYLEISRYAKQLDEYLAYYPSAQIRVLEYECLRDDPRSTLKDVLAFMGLDGSLPEIAALRERPARIFRRTRLDALLRRFVKERAMKRIRSMRHIGRLLVHVWPVELDDSTQTRLGKMLRQDVARLREQTGLAFDRWKV